MTVGLGHGLQAIEHHVQDHLLELDPVAADDRQARGEVHRHRHVPEDHVVPHELRHFADDVVDVERQVLEGALLEQNPQSLDDLGRTLVVGHDVVEDLAQLLEIRRVGLQVLLGDFRVVENRRQGLVELVRQRRRQLAHGRDAADVRQLLTEPSRLALRLRARERVGHGLANEVQLLHQLVRPRALRADRRDQQASEDGPGRPQRHGDHRRDAVGKLLRPRDANDLAGLQPDHQPRHVAHVGRAVEAPGRPGRAPCRERDQRGAIHAQGVDDRAQGAVNGLIEIEGRHVGESDGQVREQPLEPQPLGERQLHALALQRAGKRLAQQGKPIGELVGPVALGVDGVEGQHAEHWPAGLQRDGQVRAGTQALVAGPVRRRLLGQGGGPRESDDAPTPQRAGRPRELPRLQDGRQRLDARLGPRDADAGTALAVLVEIAPVDPEEGHHLPQRALESGVQASGLDVNELRRQVREQRLEPKALLQHGDQRRRGRVEPRQAHAGTLPLPPGPLPVLAQGPIPTLPGLL